MLEMFTILSYGLVGGARQLAADISLSAVLQNPSICGQNSRQNQVSAKRIHTSSLPNTKHRNMSAILPKHNAGNACVLPCRILFKDKDRNWDDIESKLSSDSDIPLLKTTNKVCSVTQSLGSSFKHVKAPVLDMQLKTLLASRIPLYTL